MGDRDPRQPGPRDLRARPTSPRPVPRIRTGRAELPEPPIALRAGDLTADLVGIDLRRIRAGGLELASRIYMALRDAPWNTIPPVVHDLVIAREARSFRITFRATHRHGAMELDWEGTIEGGEDGTIRYAMDGTTRVPITLSRVGINLHLALGAALGRPYRAEGADGARSGTIDPAVVPQRWDGSALHGAFPAFRTFALSCTDAFTLHLGIEGDELEVEDHRNWTDANLKVYAQPLALGFPRDLPAGTRIRQVVTLRGEGTPPPAESGDPVLTVGPALGRWLPGLGLRAADDAHPLSGREAELLAELAPDHLRADLRLAPGAWSGPLAAVTAEAERIGAALELALAIPADGSAEAELPALAAALRTSGTAVARALVHEERARPGPLPSASAAAVARVRDALVPVTGPVVVAGGSDNAWAEVNRARPMDPAIEGIAFPACPAVHAADDDALMENVDGLRATVADAVAVCAPRSIHVSPITLATRGGPYPAGPAAEGDLPPHVDVRQAALFGAAWTAGAIGALAAAGAASATFFATTGWTGVVERDAGPPDPVRFPGRPGTVHPAWHVLADAGAWKAAPARITGSSAPTRLGGFAVELHGGLGVVVANLTAGPLRARIAGLPAGSAEIRILDEASAEGALADPIGFRAAPGRREPVMDGALVLGLLPYAVARIRVRA